MLRLSTVLLVEDDPFDENMTLRALRNCERPPKVDVVRSGLAALEYFFGSEKHPAPSLIILDLRLPAMDGLEVLERLRSDESTRQIPVVVLTSSDRMPDVTRAYALGANSFIRKPDEGERYVEVVKILGDYWLETNRRPGMR